MMINEEGTYESNVVDNFLIDKLEQDLKEAAKKMGPSQVRFLVDHYYAIQEFRKSAANQARSLEKAEEPIEILSYFFKQSEKLEKYLQTTLDVFSYNHSIGHWARDIKGIGPVISAGLISHIDINKAPTVGHIWRFAGLDSTVKWEKGQRRPWNARLKVLCWKIGDCFVKCSGGEKPSPYGIRYKAWKQVYVKRNELGMYEDLARETLETRNFRSDSDAVKHYKEGKLPPGRLDLRARRKAVKLYLSHLHDYWYRTEFKKDPPVPYVIEHGGHAHFIPRPDQIPQKDYQEHFGRTPFDVELGLR